MNISTLTYQLQDVLPYINWLYYFHAWQMPARYGSLSLIHPCAGCRAQWVAQFKEEDQPQAREAIRLFDDATAMLNEFSEKYHTLARFGLFQANSEEDDLLIQTTEGTMRLPLLRQQHSDVTGKPNLCLSDFIRPTTMHKPDHIGLFATTVPPEMEQAYGDDPYRHLLAQTLADRLAEATAELLHADVRRHLWGYAGEDERLTVEEMFQGKYQGIRPAVGYPSLPDQSLNFLLQKLIDFSAIGITLTESGAMQPHGSVSGLMLAHPKAQYFSVGRIGEDQLADYARRRGIDTETLRQFLTANL